MKPSFRGSFIFNKLNKMTDSDPNFLLEMKEKNSGLKEKINRMIMDLPEKERQDFSKQLEDRLYDRNWCRIHKIDYSNPDFTLAKSELYKELYKKE